MAKTKESPAITASSTLFLRAVIVLAAMAAAAALLCEPLTEGRNVHATLFQIYFADPFLACVYLASVPFFVALYQGFRVLGSVARNQTFSPATVRAVRAIKRCAFTLAGAVAAVDAYLILSYHLIASHSQDDPAGAVMIGVVVIFATMVIATAASVLERVLRHAVELKSENELTV